MIYKDVHWGVRYVRRNVFQQEEPLIWTENNAFFKINGKNIKHDFVKNNVVETVQQFKILSSIQLDFLSLKDKVEKSEIKPCYIEFVKNGRNRNYYFVSDIEKVFSFDYKKYIYFYFLKKRSGKDNDLLILNKHLYKNVF